MTSISEGPIPPPPVARSGSVPWRLLVVVATILVILFGVLVWWFFFHLDYGDPTRRVSSPTGEYEVVQYDFSAMIDPGWNLTIERVDGDGREWFWRSVEHRAPRTIRFSGATSIEVIDEDGSVYRLQFDPDSLEPTERYCLRPDYCTSHPWDNYTRDAP